jgi:mono/diheme cytochrome c family protein
MLAALAAALLAGGPDPALVERGKALYAENRCSTCHQVAGKGNPLGPHDGVGARLSAAELRQWIVDPRGMARKTKAVRKPPMPVFDTLKKADVDALVVYLSTLKTAAPPAPAR